MVTVPRGKRGVFALQKLTCRVCVAVSMTRGRSSESSPTAVYSGSEDLRTHPEETKRVKFLEFLVS